MGELGEGWEGGALEEEERGFVGTEAHGGRERSIDEGGEGGGGEFEAGFGLRGQNGGEGGGEQEGGEGRQEGAAHGPSKSRRRAADNR